MNKLLFMAVLFSSSVVFTADSGMNSPAKQGCFKIADGCSILASLIENASRDHETMYKEGVPYNLFVKLCSSGLVNRKLNGTTALHEAVKAGKEENVRMLLLHSANPNATDDYGQTPYHRARLAGNDNIIEQLRCVGAEDFAQTVAPFSERPQAKYYSSK